VHKRSKQSKNKENRTIKTIGNLVQNGASKPVSVGSPHGNKHL
jgi:hypothetical protein